MLAEQSPILPCSTVITLPRATPFNIVKFARQNDDRATASSAVTTKEASEERKQEQVESSEPFRFELKMNLVDSKQRGSHIISEN